MKLNWDEKFEIGHSRIDFEHRIFLDLISGFSTAAQTGASRERLMRTLLEIEKYADFHFTSEENLMEDSAYPDRKHHAQLHAGLLSSLRNRRVRFALEGETADEVFDFLFQWFALHTTQEDRKLAAYLAPGT